MAESELPDPMLLGYRPRIPWFADSTFSIPGVTVASVSDCLVDPVLPDEPDWDHMNTAFHFESVREAAAAAKRQGAAQFEIHATRLWPVLFAGNSRQRFELKLQTLNRQACQVEELPLSSKSLGFDVVSVLLEGLQAGKAGNTYLRFGCAPLSCNEMGEQHPINGWCLLDRIEDAITAATAFAKDEPEPGPFVIVQVFLCKT